MTISNLLLKIKINSKRTLDADGFKKEYGVKNFVGNKNSLDAKKHWYL